MSGKELGTLGSGILTAARTLTIVVIDPFDVVYAGIKAWFEEEPSLITNIVGHYRTIGDFLADDHTNGSQVNVILAGLDAEERGPDFAALRELCVTGHPVVVYSRLTDRDMIRTAIDSGAVTYLVKSEGREHLVKAARAAATNSPYVGPAMAVALASAPENLRPVLAPREQEVLIAWFQTDSKDLVAQQLFLAPSTVRTHLQRIRAKYAAVGRPASTKAALVARAIQDRIIDIDAL
jgi:DNA-binding NarL/FixJ family response regulator